MVKFTEVGGAMVNAGRVLMVRPELVINSGRRTGYAEIVFDNGRVERVPLRGLTVAEFAAKLAAEG
jgi:hypothetical protein